MVWNPANENMVPRAEAESKIGALAKSKGIKGSFKVFYNGTIVEDPTDLPDQVDMTLVKVSATLDQAAKKAKGKKPCKKC